MMKSSSAAMTKPFTLAAAIWITDTFQTKNARRAATTYEIGMARLAGHRKITKNKATAAIGKSERAANDSIPMLTPRKPLSAIGLAFKGELTPTLHTSLVRWPSKAVDYGMRPRLASCSHISRNVEFADKAQLGVSHGKRRPWKAILLCFSATLELMGDRTAYGGALYS